MSRPGRPTLGTRQRIFDLFAELETEEQAALLTELQAMYRFCLKRDARKTGIEANGEADGG